MRNSLSCQIHGVGSCKCNGNNPIQNNFVIKNARSFQATKRADIKM